MVRPVPVDAVGPGDHACLTFSDADERLDIVATFVRDGLGLGQKVICFTESISPDRLAGELVERQVATDPPAARGQLAVRSSDESWLATGSVTAAGMVDMLDRELRRASREGYPGLRVTADMCWALRPLAAVDQLLVFESEVSKLFSDGRLTAICQYDRHSFDPVTLAFAAQAHPQAVAATVYYEDPVVRICRQHAPPGIRAAGELDYRRVGELTHALSESLRLDHDVHVNFARLRYIDVAAASAVVQAALSLPDGRVMTVSCGGLVGRVLTMVGGHDLTRLRVRVAHGER